MLTGVLFEEARPTLKLLAKREADRGFEDTSTDDAEEGRGEEEWSRVCRRLDAAGNCWPLCWRRRWRCRCNMVFTTPYPTRAPSTNFQTGVGMDAADDLTASALAGGSVTPLV